jgi:hypothetical protein
LRRLGYKVTQSSVSRDLQALGIVRRKGLQPAHPTLFVVTDSVYDSRLLMQRLKRVVKA